MCSLHIGTHLRIHTLWGQNTHSVREEHTFFEQSTQCDIRTPFVRAKYTLSEISVHTLWDQSLLGQSTLGEVSAHALWGQCTLFEYQWMCCLCVLSIYGVWCQCSVLSRTGPVSLHRTVISSPSFLFSVHLVTVKLSPNGVEDDSKVSVSVVRVYTVLYM